VLPKTKKNPQPSPKAAAKNKGVVITPASPRDNDAETRGRSKTKKEVKGDANTSAKKSKTPSKTAETPNETTPETDSNNDKEKLDETPLGDVSETPVGTEIESTNTKKKEKGKEIEKEKLVVKTPDQDKSDKRSSSWSPAPWYKQNLTAGLNDFWEEKGASRMRGKWHDDLEHLETTPKIGLQTIRFSPSPDKRKYEGTQRTVRGGRKRARKNVQKKKERYKIPCSATYKRLRRW